MSIELTQVSKRFGDFVAIDQMDLSIPSGQLTALLGPSGSGKTTLLRIIAGLEQQDAGRIHFHGEDTTEVHVSHRGVGFVFQHYALFRHMTVFENVAFGLRVKARKVRPSETVIRQRVMDTLKLVQLDWTAERYPSQLSGGQRQRIALARALVIEPKVLLLDEPFGALDTKVRVELRRWLRRLHDEIDVTSVFVTHDQDEALEVSDQVVIMNQGRLEQQGTPEVVYDHPANAFVYDFLGHVNQFQVSIQGDSVHLDGHPIHPSQWPQGRSGEGLAYVRPHDVSVAPQPDAAHRIPATIELLTRFGPTLRLELSTPSAAGLVHAEIPKRMIQATSLAPGDGVWLGLNNSRIFMTGDPLPPI